MADPRQSRKYKVNPMEVAILSVVSLLFVNSVYNLFYDWQGLHPTPHAAKGSGYLNENRVPAGIQQTYLTLDVPCGPPYKEVTGALKVRLSGTPCGLDPGEEASKLLKTTISNTVNDFAASVSTDPSTGRYSTDHIPLEPGLNSISIEFSYQDGRVVTQELTLERMTSM